MKTEDVDPRRLRQILRGGDLGLSFMKALGEESSQPYEESHLKSSRAKEARPMR